MGKILDKGVVVMGLFYTIMTGKTSDLVVVVMEQYCLILMD